MAARLDVNLAAGLFLCDPDFLLQLQEVFPLPGERLILRCQVQKFRFDRWIVFLRGRAPKQRGLIAILLDVQHNRPPMLSA